MTGVNPVSIIEAYFDLELSNKSLSYFEGVSEEKWIDFAKHYYAQMKRRFQFPKEATGHRVLFDRNSIHSLKLSSYPDWYKGNPIIGARGNTEGRTRLSSGELRTLLGPLSKHLLVCDQVFIDDAFLWNFDTLAEVMPRRGWKKEPHYRLFVDRFVHQIMIWMQVFSELKPLIVTDALVFVPYFCRPSMGNSNVYSNEAFEDVLSRLSIPHDPKFTHPSEASPVTVTDLSVPPPDEDVLRAENHPDYTEALRLWLDANVSGLGFMAPDVQTWQWTQQISFQTEPLANISTNLMSLDIVPLKAGNTLNALEVANARKSEAVFQEVKKAILGCADYLSKNLSDTASDHATNKLAREYLADSLNQKSSYKLVRLMDESYFGAGVYACAISAALMSSNPWLGVAVPAALTPRLFLIAEQKIGLQSRAWAKVNALL